MLVGKICNRDVVYVEPDSTIAEAARLMREYHVGGLVVAREKSGKRIPVGIITDRDLVIEVLAEDVDLGDITVGDIMSNQLVTAREGDDLLETLKIMRARGIRRLPVIDDDGALAGILTVDDLIDLYAEQIADLARLITLEQKREQERRK